MLDARLFLRPLHHLSIWPITVPSPWFFFSYVLTTCWTLDCFFGLCTLWQFDLSQYCHIVFLYVITTCCRLDCFFGICTIWQFDLSQYCHLVFLYVLTTYWTLDCFFGLCTLLTIWPITVLSPCFFLHTHYMLDARLFLRPLHHLSIWPITVPSPWFFFYVLTTCWTLDCFFRLHNSTFTNHPTVQSGT